MGKKHKQASDAPEAATGKKARLAALEAQVQTLERRLDDLTQVVDEAIRASISERNKATEVRPRARRKAASAAGTPEA